jgi:sRNA-binding protein
LSSEKEDVLFVEEKEDSSFSEEKEAKRLLFLGLFRDTRQAISASF